MAVGFLRGQVGGFQAVLHPVAVRVEEGVVGAPIVADHGGEVAVHHAHHFIARKTLLHGHGFLPGGLCLAHLLVPGIAARIADIEGLDLVDLPVCHAQPQVQHGRRAVFGDGGDRAHVAGVRIGEDVAIGAGGIDGGPAALPRLQPHAVLGKAHAVHQRQGRQILCHHRRQVGVDKPFQTFALARVILRHRLWSHCGTGKRHQHCQT